LRVTGRTQRLLLVESATLLGIMSTLFTWFVYRVEDYARPLEQPYDRPRPILDRGFPLVSMIEADWPRHCPGW
jgi:hypothetical protein